MRFHTKLYSPATRIAFAILFFAPLPGGVRVTGELVRLSPATAPAPMPAAAPEPAPAP